MAKVKFSRGTQSNYDNLQTKDSDTVYIRTDSGNMYLGSKQLSDPNAVKSVQVGTTTTGAAGTNASVTNSGTTQNPVLDFTIPRGQGITYKNAESVTDLPTPSSSQSPYIYLIPSTTESGAVDQYACIKDAVVEGQVISGWSWVLVGSTSPFISVQQIDASQSLIPTNIYDKSALGAGPEGTGNILGSSNFSVVYEYDTTGMDSVILSGRSWIITSSQSTTRYMLMFYSNGTPITGLAANLYIPFNNTATILDHQEIALPQGCNMLRMQVSSGFTDLTSCMVRVAVTQAYIKKQVTPNTIIYGEVTIDTSIPLNVESSTENTRDTRLSGFGIVFPTNYSNVGTPTQVIAMLHGSSGYVSPSCLGYTGQEWVTWRNQYLSAGFAVMDINGFGVSTSNDQYSQPYGNPQSAETLYKAFDYIRKIYNVNDKLLIHGTSMGGANAFSFLKSHPDMVAGVGLFSPANIPYGYIFTGWTGTYQALAWGYTNKAEAIADNFSHLVGWQTMMEDDFDWENMDSSEFAAITSKTYVPSVPIRIWQGTSDTNVPLALNQKLCECLRRANIPVTLRVCTGASHNMSGGAVAYVRNEAVSWFKRFVN